MCVCVCHCVCVCLCVCVCHCVCVCVIVRGENSYSIRNNVLRRIGPDSLLIKTM